MRFPKTNEEYIRWSLSITALNVVLIVADVGIIAWWLHR